MAFWVKLNIVLFTYKPYTATKVLFPLFLFWLLWRVYRAGPRWFFRQPPLLAAMAFMGVMLVPVGYLGLEHQWATYRWAVLSLGSFGALFLGGYLLEAEYREKLLVAVFCFTLLAMVYVLAQYYLGFAYEMGHFRNPAGRPRPFGILDDPAHSSGVYLLGLALSLALPLRHRHWRWAWAAVPGFVWALYISHTLGSYLGLAAMLGGWVLLSPLIWRPPARKILTWALFLFWLSWLPLSFGLVHLYRGNLGGVVEEIQQTEKFWSVELRVQLHEGALLVFQERPWFGIGLANDHTLAMQKKYSVSHHIPIRKLAQHHTGLAVLTNAGLVGMLAFVVLVFWVLRGYAGALRRAATHRARAEVLVWLGFFFALQVLSQTILMLYSVSFWFSMLLPRLLEPPPAESDHAA